VPRHLYPRRSLDHSTSSSTPASPARSLSQPPAISLRRSLSDSTTTKASLPRFDASGIQRVTPLHNKDMDASSVLVSAWGVCRWDDLVRFLTP
ncbi:unnamed protein product, partial [Mycena citricolor]